MALTDIKAKLNAEDVSRLSKLFAKLGAAFGNLSKAAVEAGEAFNYYAADLPEEDE